MRKSGKEFTSDELIAHWESLVDKYPIISIEDVLDEEDWEGWQRMTAKIGNKVQLVGDDLFVTNTERLSKGISLGAGNSRPVHQAVQSVLLNITSFYALRSSSETVQFIPEWQHSISKNKKGVKENRPNAI